MYFLILFYLKNYDKGGKNEEILTIFCKMILVLLK